jgi:mannose-6-phosphate isomerase
MASGISVHKLSPQLFTPLKRTPWAGSYITSYLKDEILPQEQGSKVGESWEFSCDPDFPSKIITTGESLANFFKKREHNCDLLVKILNANQNLSVQIHPPSGHPRLKASESGKPECWYILHAEKGAGLYLGFKAGINKSTLRSMLNRAEDLTPILQFVPVDVGDFFVIDAGVVHAIGAGVTLIEPQQVRQGQSGKTYRLWDWNRLYADDGTMDPVNGKARELHIEESLELFDPNVQCGEDFVATLRRNPQLERVDGIEHRIYPSVGYARLHHFKTTQSNSVWNFSHQSYACLLMIQGAFTVDTIHLSKGENALLEPSSYKVKLDQMCEWVIIENLSH